MQPLDHGDLGSALPSGAFSQHFSRLSLNGNVSGFSHGALHSNKTSLSGFRDRLNGNLPSLNTAARNQNSGMSAVAELQTPQTAFDLNYTPLLPSQLLMGSPFQPGSPTTFATPQFQSFPTFQPINGQPRPPHPGPQLGSPAQTHQPLSPQFQNLYHSTAMGSAQLYGMNQLQGVGYPGLSNTFATSMPMVPGLGSSTTRTVYLGNIPPDTSAEEILGHVRSGQIESVRLLPDRNCAFISFLDGSSAVHFHSDAVLKKLSIRGQDIKIGWGKPSHIPSTVALAVQQSGASRNVYLGNLPPDISEDEIREDLGRFGAIDTVKLVREKNIGFIHFLTISSAVKAVSQLPQEPNWQPPRRVFYGKDRCAYVSKTQQQNAAQYLGIPSGYAHVLNSADRDLITNALAQQSVAAAAVATAAGGTSNLGNRTVYLGNIHPETTTEEICNVVRGGLLHHIRYIPDKHICFVTFIDPTAAASFFALSNMQGLMIHNRRLKIGWGKHSQALPPAIALAVSGGASRNVYIGNIDESWTEERLRQDFSEYGDIELVNTLREKSCAFVNFTNIANAIKAIEQVRGLEDYKRFKINFGKDRCGNPPRQVQHHQAQSNAVDQSQHQQAHGGQDGVGSPEAIKGPRLRTSPPSSGNSRTRSSDMLSSTNLNGTAPDIQTGNPLHMYLNHIASTQQVQQQQQHQQQQQQHPQLGQQDGTFQQHATFDHLLPSQASGPSLTPTNARPLDAARQLPNGAFHGASSSFSLHNAAGAGLGMNGLGNDEFSNGGSTTIDGLLAPNRAGQHSRAISLPAIGQYQPFQSMQQPPHGLHGNNFGYEQAQHQSMNGTPIEIAHSATNGLSNGLNSFGGFGLAIHNDSTLPRWTKEEVTS